MIGKLSHIAMIVRDAEATARLLRDVLDADVRLPPVDGEGHREVLVRLGETWCVLVEGPTQRTRTGDHLAFAATPAQLRECERRLRARGVDCQLARNDTALYFSDDDHHVFELDTTDFETEAAAAAPMPPER